MLGFYLTLLDSAEEKSKFEQLYITYLQDIFKISYSILKYNYEAEDAVHEAFLIVIKKFDKISEVNCPQTHAYLIIIVKNLALKIYNKRKKAKTEDIENIDIVDETDVEEAVIDEMTIEQVEEILMKLPENYYHILYLEQYMGFSIDDISESLDITYENAKKRLQRAKNKFKQMVKECLADAT